MAMKVELLKITNTATSRKDMINIITMNVVINNIWWQNKWTRIFDTSCIDSGLREQVKDILCHIYDRFVHWEIFVSPLSIILMNSIVLG